MRAHGAREIRPGIRAAIASVTLVAFIATGVAAQDASPSGAPPSPVSGRATQVATGDVAGAAFLPADTVVYLELQGGLPAGQAEALGEVLARFPGMEGLTAVEPAIDDLLEAWLSQATGGAFSWKRDIRSWFGGRISAGLFDVASAARGDPSLLVGIEVTDPQQAAGFAERIAELVAGDVSGALVEEVHSGVPVVSGGDGSWAYALVDDLLLLGTGSEDVRAGLDAYSGVAPALASVAEFRTAFARVPEGRLIAGWSDIASLRPLMVAAAMVTRERTPVDLVALLDSLPRDVTAYLAARPDGAILQAFGTPGEGTPTLSQGDPHLAASFPSGTSIFLETPQLGSWTVTAAEWLGGLLALGPDDEPSVDLLVSGLDNLLGWVGDVAIGGGMDDGRAWFGAVVEGAADGAADPYLGLVQAALALATLGTALDPYPSPSGPGFDLDVSDVDGVEVVTLSLDPADMGGSLLVEPAVSLARDGDHLLVGTPGWVQLALGPGIAATLADDAGYQAALAAAGEPDRGHLYVDITAIREAIEPIFAFTAPEYAEVAPWLIPFDRAIAGYGVTADGAMTITVVLMLR
jgi:hypothetical protein